MGFSPTPPPQAARAFVSQVLGRRRGRRLEVTLFEPEPGRQMLEIVNGNRSVSDAEYAYVSEDGAVVSRTAGAIPPYGVVNAELAQATAAVVVTYVDARGRRYATTWDGRTKRMRNSDTSDSILRELYGDSHDDDD